MANNIKPGANAVVAKAAATFASLSLSTTNTSKIFEVDGLSLKSWVPGRAINGIVGTTQGKGYYFVAKQSMDLESTFAPPTGGDDVTAVDLGEFN